MYGNFFGTYCMDHILILFICIFYMYIRLYCTHIQNSAYACSMYMYMYVGNNRVKQYMISMIIHVNTYVPFPNREEARMAADDCSTESSSHLDNWHIVGMTSGKIIPIVPKA